jgi:ribonuclease P/MRP protein subunit POP1
MSDTGAPIDEEASINAAPILPSVSSTPVISPWLLPDTFLPILTPISSTASPAIQLLKAINAFRSQRALAPIPSSRAETIYDTAILHVRVEVFGRGSPGDMAEIHALDSEERGVWLDARRRDETVGKLTWDASAEPKSALQVVSGGSI